MAKHPYMPLWTDAYLGDTGHLTTIEHGAYLLLLMTAWRSKDKCLPDDDKMLARYARLTTAQWQRIKPVISAFFTITSKGWHQGRLTDEAYLIERISRLQSDRAKSRWLKDNDTSDAVALPDGCLHTHTHTHIKKEDTSYLPKKDEKGASQEEVRAEPRSTAPASTTPRGSRLKPDWELPLPWGEWAVNEGLPSKDVQRVADKFKDYWLSAPGQRGTKANWESTWKNWVRRTLDEGR